MQIDWQAIVAEELARQTISSGSTDFHRSITHHEIIRAVCDESHIDICRIYSPSTAVELARTRAIIVGLLRDLLYPQPSYPQIAHWLCRVGHSGIFDQHRRWSELDEMHRKRWSDDVYSRIIRARG